MLVGGRPDAPEQILGLVGRHIHTRTVCWCRTEEWRRLVEKVTLPKSSMGEAGHLERVFDWCVE